MSAVLDLFVEEVEKTPEQLHVQADPVERAVAAMQQVLLQGKSPILAFSSGKDSSCCALVTFLAALRVRNALGSCPKLFLVNADTRVESPVVRNIADTEIRRMQTFAKENGLQFAPRIATPSLARSFGSRIIGGRALPSFAGLNSTCSQEWKVQNSARAIREIEREAKATGTVLVIGTRRAESAARAQATAQRGETAHQTWFGPEGDERISPILDWSTDDVWETLGRAAAGQFPSYSRFEELQKFYGAAGASSCVIVADMNAAASSKPCGARSGCWSCLRVKNDHSVENMIATDPHEYRYLQPLLRLRNLMADTQWDYSLRNYVGRTIEDGWINIRADQYSPEMCKTLLRYTLWAQDEANRLGAPSWVEPIGIRDLFAIDALWSARALHPPFEALKVYLEHRAGMVAVPPVLTHKVPPAPAPHLGRIFVGGGWEDPAHPMNPEGLRHATWEMFQESCGPSLRVGNDGEVFMALEEENEFDVDEEGASLFLEFEAERKIAEYAGFTGDWTAGFLTLVSYGCVSLAKGQSSAMHSMLRRSAWLQRNDLHGQRDPEDLRRRCDEVRAQQVALF